MNDDQTDAYLAGMRETIEKTYPGKDIMKAVRDDPQILFLLAERQRAVAKFDAKITQRLAEILKDMVAK